MKSSQQASNHWLPQAASTRSAVLVAAAMVAIGLLARVLPHPPNFSPVGSLALFSGAFFVSRRLAVMVPLAVMLITDVALGLYGAMWATYACFVVSVMLGRWVRQQPSVTRIAGASITGSVLFFVATNLVIWMTWYEPTLAGLTTCFTLALPFFQNTLMGDAMFTTVMFGTAALVSFGMPQPAAIPAFAKRSA